jgi:hypothetical protein
MALQCRCGQPIEAFGVPSCYTKMAPIVRLIFTTKVNQLITNPATQLELSPSNSSFPDIYRLITPRLDDVTSDRPEAITEEIGATTYYVRDAARTITATVGQLPTEWAQRVAELRCQTEVGVFLVDANGTVWGRKVETNTGVAGAALPVVPSSIDARFAFPSYSSVQKHTIAFQLPFSLADYEIIPLWQSDNFLNYSAPQPVGFRVFQEAGNWVVFLFSKYHAPNGTIVVPIANVAPVSAIEIYDATGSTLVASGNANLGGGKYSLNNPLTPGTQYILDCTAVTSPPLTQFDWPAIRVPFRA